MATDKYDLHTIDYSVQGWDTIMATDMEKLDDEVNTRILCTLGETVAVSDALYLHTDGKYYKAQADGTKQPAMGLAVETGVLDDSIRIQRVGPMTNAGWSWGIVGDFVFLSSSVAGEVTESEPALNSQTVGTILSSTSIYISLDTNVTISGGGGGGVTNHSELSNLDYASAGHTGFAESSHSHTENDISDLDKYTQAEVDAEIATKPDTLLELTDTPAVYDNNKYLRSTVDGTEWSTISGGGGIDHSELSNLDYASAGHTGQLTLGEHDIKLDSLLSADGKYSGKTFDGVLGDTLVYGDLVYLNTTDQRWELTDADAEATSGYVDLAIVLAAGSGGDTRLLLTKGFIREDDWNFTSYGKALYISTTSGTMTQTAPASSGDIVRVVGYASTSADQIYFNPSKTWIELS